MAETSESVLADLRTRLLTIKGGAGYAFSASLKAVDRYVHQKDGAESVANSMQPPRILIKGMGESTSRMSKSSFMTQFQIAVLFLVSADASDEHLTAARDDVKRCLFSQPSWHGGWNEQLTSTPIAPEEGMPHDGIQFTLTVTYQEDF